MQVISGKYYDFNNVLILPKRSRLGSRSEVVLEKTVKFLHSGFEWTGIPIMAANMDTTGTFEMYNVLKRFKMITVLHKQYKIEDYPDSLDPNYYSLSTGVSESDWEKIVTLIAKLNPHFLTIDVANGYSTKFVEFCKRVREAYPKLTIIAGNVATGDMVQELLLTARVDVVKCGIGSGSVCSTRIKTGVGVPQLSVCLNCSEVANGLNGHIVSDGGCTIPADVAKAFGAGAHFVMLGGMLSGHDESGGDTIIEHGNRYKLFYGMSSKHAQDKHNGGLQSYRSCEGKVKKIPYKGKVEETILDLLGGLRSTGTYIGAGRIKDFPKCCSFIEVSQQVNNVYDSRVHNIN